MPSVPMLDPDDAPKEIADLYKEFQRRLGFPIAPNFIKTQGHAA